VGEVKLAGGQQSGQALGVAAIGLDAIVGRPGDRPGRRDADVEPTLGAGAGQPKPVGPAS
jgi:hypothetical protein